MNYHAFTDSMRTSGILGCINILFMCSFTNMQEVRRTSPQPIQEQQSKVEGKWRKDKIGVGGSLTSLSVTKAYAHVSAFAHINPALDLPPHLLFCPVSTADRQFPASSRCPALSLDSRTGWMPE